MTQALEVGELLELLFDTTTDYAIILMDEAGLVRRWNRAAVRIFGYPAAEMEGRSGREIFVEPDRRAGVPEMELRTAAEQGRAEDERWHRRKDGSRFWGSGVMMALHREGRRVGFAKVVQDLSERRRMEEAVQESQRVETLGVLAAGVAHDFNNVLTAVVGNLGLARQSLGAGNPRDDAETLIEDAERAAHRAAELVRQLLSYAGKARRTVEPVDVCRVAGDALEVVRATVEPRITLRLDLPPGCAPVEADVGQLRQLLLNLILNGAEAIADGPGEVHVRLRVRDVSQDELRRFHGGFALPARRYVEIVVRDTGRGMDPATLRQIFDPFFTTKFLGRGLGLAAALGIVRSHGGGIAVESAEGEGSTFTVLLPAEAGREPVQTASEAIAGTAKGDGLVLVVDDEPGIRSLVQRAVERLGYTVILAENGEQALQVFERVGRELVLVLLDLAMPALDGTTTAVRLHAARPDLPILVMTGLADSEALAGLADLRIAGFLAKPFNPEQLAQTVAVALRLSGE